MSVAESALATRYQHTRHMVSDYAHKYQRQAKTIKLIAVSKRHDAEKVVELVKLGHRDFAENYLQEGVGKIHQVKCAIDDMGMKNSPCWHFIGHIQSRKCKEIAACFDWVHTVDSIKVADKLNQHRNGRLPLNVLIQLNLQHSSKSGIGLPELPKLADAINELPNLKLCGLMMIPEVETDFEKQRAIFNHCRRALEQLKPDSSLNQLSMGMSADLEAAIAEGATQLRIGTAIFGARPIRKNPK